MIMLSCLPLTAIEDASNERISHVRKLPYKRVLDGV
jgi:hypothetical protein